MARISAADNTQQHWLSHRDGLCLIYTRRGANNDHVIRNGAPLFIAGVDPERLRVLRATERVLIPGARGGSCGTSARRRSVTGRGMGERGGRGLERRCSPARRRRRPLPGADPLVPA